MAFTYVCTVGLLKSSTIFIVTKNRIEFLIIQGMSVDTLYEMLFTILHHANKIYENVVIRIEKLQILKHGTI